jgi:hypothetical protein
LFNTTSGKSAGYSMAIDGYKLDAYASNGPALDGGRRVNQQKDVCTGTWCRLRLEHWP